MGIVSIILYFMIAILVVYLLFRIFKWIFTKRVRIIRVFLLLVFLAVGITVNKLFFVKMEFIQSQVYPNLYLVKNPDKDKNIVRQAIKEFILQLKHSQLVHKNGASKKIQFYEYTTGDLGENGTAYFLKHKERADGMTAELLEYYPDYLLATFSIPSCGEGSTSNYGTLAYYKDRNIIKTDTLINLCKK